MHLCGSHACSFCQKLWSKTSSWTHNKILHVCWFLGRVCLLLSFQKACKAEREGGRGGKSLISFGIAVQRLLLMKITSSYFMYLLSKPLLAVVPEAGWVMGCLPSRPEGSPGSDVLFGNFIMCCCIFKARSKKCAYCLRGKKRRFLMQLNACRSLFYGFEQIPETCYYVGNRAFL